MKQYIEDINQLDHAIERARKEGTPLPEIDAKYDEGFVIPGYESKERRNHVISHGKGIPSCL